MKELNLEKFNPTVAELNSLVEKWKEITKVALADDETSKAHLKVVKTARIELRDARVKIEKAGKALRDDANAFNKAVIAKERELIAIVEPEEKRLKEIEEEAERIAQRKINELQLPERKERMEVLGFSSPSNIADEYIIAMNSQDFEVYYNGLVAEKNRLEIEQATKEQEQKDALLREREEKVKEAERKIEEEKRAQEREEKAHKEEREKIEQEKKEQESLEREKREQEMREKMRLEAEEKEEEERLEKAEKYQAFLKEHGYSEETKNDFVLEKVGNKIRLAKILGIFTLE